MTLIKSISGIRGTIGGKVGDNLTPLDTVKFASAYGTWLKSNNNSNGNKKLKVVVGRDARISGPMVHNLVVNTLLGLGIDVIDLGLSTTPTVEVAVPLEAADGGIILTASHNPKQWNALKLLNEKGEFLNAENGEKILEIAESEAFDFSEVDDLGEITINDAYMDIHIDEVLNLSLVDIEAVKAAKFKVVVDAVNSSGGIIIPRLLELMGVEVVKLYCEPNGHFPHNPEPLKEHLTDISELVVKEQADLGIVVDPDVDRLAFVCEDCANIHIVTFGSQARYVKSIFNDHWDDLCLKSIQIGGNKKLFELFKEYGIENDALQIKYKHDCVRYYLNTHIA
jgi:phosphomannomutase